MESLQIQMQHLKKNQTKIVLTLNDVLNINKRQTCTLTRSITLVDIKGVKSYCAPLKSLVALHFS